MTNKSSHNNEVDKDDTLTTGPNSPAPHFAVSAPDGEEEKPLFDDDQILPVIDLPPPPDGGWGWVICFASFMCNLILDGIAYTFGVFLEPLVNSFESNSSTVAWVGSILCGVYLTSGPIVGGLVNKFGCRPVCITGSLIACVGMALSTLSPNVSVLMLTYGVIGGFGLGLIYLPAVVAVGYYFERRRALATGISVCGSGVGTFLFAPLGTFLLNQYGWKGAHLILAGLCLNCAVFGALMRPLELTAGPMTEEDKKRKELSRVNSKANIPFTVELPDGTHQRHNHNSSENATPYFLTPNASFHMTDDAMTLTVISPPSMNIPQLPTIEESDQSVTKPESSQHKSVLEIFPKEDEIEEVEEEEHEDEHDVSRPTRGRISRRRTTSETAASVKFHVTPVRNQSGENNSNIPNEKEKDSKLPRNSTDPNFARQFSNPALGALMRLTSLEEKNKLFGIHGSQVTSNTTLHLEPQSLSRRGSKASVIVRPLYRKDVFYSGSVTHLTYNEATNQIVRNQSSGKFSNVPSFANLDEYRHSIISIPRGTSRRQSTAAFSIAGRSSIVASHLSIPPAVRRASGIPPEDDDGEGGRPIISALKEMINVQILANPLFLLICISNVFGMLGFYTPFVYLPNMANSKGIAKEDANFLISIIGIANTLGRVAAGWLSDLPCVNPLVVTNVAIFLSGVCTFILPVVPASYPIYVAVSVAFGLAVAAYISLSSIVLVELLGIDSLTSAFGLLVLFRGFSSLIGSPAIGAVYDATESYELSFYIAGGFLMVAAGISCIADFLHRRNVHKSM